ncbi:alpha-2-antiplasmin isoform X3 [Vulpes vulpes]|uniref:Alpha-2-antiplasmin isoform X3 n=2 Tax=Vulpes vulpes TaxID=9627 RepID=A0ABM4ZNB2_VULVU
MGWLETEQSVGSTTVGPEGHCVQQQGAYRGQQQGCPAHPTKPAETSGIHRPVYPCGQDQTKKRNMALLRGLLVISLSCLQGSGAVFSPASAMEPLDQQLMGGQTQEKLPPLTLLKLGNQVQPGAQNQTLRRLEQVLHADSGPCLPHLLSRLCQDLGPGAFRLAARMYLQKGFPIKEDFLKQSEQLFGAKPMSLTGRKGDDLLNINQWVKEATEGKIEDFLSELPDDTVLLLLNAIHFQGFWRSKFDPSLTQRDSFHLNEQFTVPVDMMHARTYPLRWFLLEQPEIQVAHFPFKNNMSFVVIMPTHFEWNVSQVLANLSWDILHQPLLREKPTKVRLPKLHLNYQLDLVATLSRLGLQELFQAPDLRGISDQSLVVTSVQHQSALELSEAGVEAAAATGTAMSRMSLSSFSVNRPFLFFILEDTTSLPLFVGSVKNPNPSAPWERKEQQDSPDDRDYFQNQKAFPRGDKPFGPDLKLAPPSEEDYPQLHSPK